MAIKNRAPSGALSQYSKSNHSSSKLFLSALRHAASLLNKEILHYASSMWLPQVILVSQSHPSGAVSPSRNDNHVTKLSQRKPANWWECFLGPSDCLLLRITLVPWKGGYDLEFVQHSPNSVLSLGGFQEIQVGHQDKEAVRSCHSLNDSIFRIMC